MVNDIKYFNTQFNTEKNDVYWKISHCIEVIFNEMYINITCSFCVVWTDYPWRAAAQSVTSNVIKWFYLPDFAKRPNPTFIFCEDFFTLRQRRNPILSLCTRFWPSLSGSVQMTTSCCSAHLFSGWCLRRRTERPFDCWLEIMLRSAAVWIPVPSTSSSLSITSFTAGHQNKTSFSKNISSILLEHSGLNLKKFHSRTV